MDTSKVAVAIISRKKSHTEGEYLLISTSKDFGEYTGFYYPPGGHVQKDETIRQALKRELKEELSLEIEPIKELAKTENDVKGETVHWWECRIVSGIIKPKEQKFTDVQFFNKQELLSLKLWPATRKFFNEYLFKNNRS